MKNKINFLIALIAISLLSLTFVSALTMIRTVSTIALPGSTFTVTYTVSGATGGWGASIIDNVVGGCKFPGGVTQLKTVMLSVDGATKSVTVTAPSGVGSCTFTGDYKFGTDPIVNFQTATTTIGTTTGDTTGGTTDTTTTTTTTTCPAGQIKCSDGLCKATCEVGGGINTTWIILIVIAIGIGILWFVFRKKKQ